MLNLLFYSFWWKLKLLFRHKAVSIRSWLTKWLLVNKCSCLRLPIDFPCIRRRQNGQRFTEATTMWEPSPEDGLLSEGCWEAWARDLQWPDPESVGLAGWVRSSKGCPEHQSLVGQKVSCELFLHVSGAEWKLCLVNPKNQKQPPGYGGCDLNPGQVSRVLL